MTPTTKQYYAFISYKRDDQKWAEWLQEKLEHYKLPTNLNGRSDLPKEIRPVFRDKSELAAGVLADEIQKALNNSKYLIVICSPHSAKSEWVNKEVQAFIDSGRTDKIIPFIIEGVPNSNNDETECFPKAIRELPAEDELLGVNINEMGRDAAAVKVIAQMFGLRFDDLWQRHEREQRRKRFLTIGAALLLALIGVGVAVGFSRQNKRISEQNDKIVLQNEEISKKSDEVSKQNAEISKKNERLQNDSLIMAAQLDSINRRDALIEKQQDSISSTNKNLATANRSLESANKNLETAKGNLETAYEQLENERDNLAKTIWKMKENQSKIIAKNIISWAKDNPYLAKKIAVEMLPANLSNPVDRPYTPEAEMALRMANDLNTIVLSQHDGEVVYADFTQDGKKIFSVTKNSIYIWDYFTGERLLKKEFNKLKDVDYCKTKGQFVVADDTSIMVFDENAKEIKTINGCKDGILSVALSYDGKKIASLSNDSVLRVWNVESDKEILVINNVSYMASAKLRFIENGYNMLLLTKSKPAVGLSDFSEDSEGYMIGYNYMLSVIDGITGDKKSVMEDRAGIVTTTSDGKYLIVSGINVMLLGGTKICKTDDTKNAKYKIGGNNTTSLVFTSNEDRIVTSHAGGYIAIWDSKTINRIRAWRAHKSYINNVLLSSDENKIITASRDGTVKIWDMKSEKEKNFVAKNVENRIYAQICKDKKRIVYGTKVYAIELFEKAKPLHIYNFETGERKFEFDVKKIQHFAMSPDGNQLLFFSYRLNNSSFSFFDMNTGGFIKKLSKGLYSLYFMRYTPDSRYIIAATYPYGYIEIIDVETGEVVKKYDNSVKSFVYNDDMSRIAVVKKESNTVSILEPESFDEIMVLKGYTSSVLYACFSPDGKIVAANDYNGKIIMWDVQSGLILHKFDGGYLNKNNTSFSSDGKYVLLKMYQNILNVYSVENGCCVYSIEIEDDVIQDYSFTDDGKHIICVLYEKGEVRQYDFPPLQDLIDQTRERFKNRPLTDEERKMYYLE